VSDVGRSLPLSGDGYALLLTTLAGPVRSADELTFRIAINKMPVANQEVELRVWVTNNSDHPIRIPTDLQRVVYPEAFQPPDYRPQYGQFTRL
jgi:hypothetical protein